MGCDTYTFEQTDLVADVLGEMKPGHVNKVMRFLDSHASRTPTVPIPVSLKELRGQWRGLWQFEVGDKRGAYRLIYTVDEARCVIRIEYLGPHPDWRRATDGGRL